jgi:hypothetical protein
MPGISHRAEGSLANLTPGKPDMATRFGFSGMNREPRTEVSDTRILSIERLSVLSLACFLVLKLAVQQLIRLGIGWRLVQEQGQIERTGVHEP